MITLNNKKVAPIKGNYKPMAIYEGSKEIFYPQLITKADTEIIIENTYNGIEYDFINIYGKSERTHTPTYDNPATIHSSFGNIISSNIPISENENLLGEKISLPILRSIQDNNGDVYARDILHINKNEKRMWIEQYIANVDNNSFLIANTANAYGRRIYTTVTNTERNKPLLSTHFSAETSSSYSAKGNYVANSETGRIHIRMDDLADIVTDTASAVNWLNENNFELFYALTQPIIIELPYRNFVTFPFKSFVYTNCNISPLIEATVQHYGYIQ